MNETDVMTKHNIAISRFMKYKHRKVGLAMMF